MKEIASFSPHSHLLLTNLLLNWKYPEKKISDFAGSVISDLERKRTTD